MQVVLTPEERIARARTAERFDTIRRRWEAGKIIPPTRACNQIDAVMAPLHRACNAMMDVVNAEDCRLTGLEIEITDDDAGASYNPATYKINLKIPQKLLLLDADKMSYRLLDYLRGMMYHEGAHALYTACGDWENQNAMGAARRIHPYLSDVLNAFEDRRVDDLMAQALPAYKMVHERQVLEALETWRENADGLPPAEQVIVHAMFLRGGIPAAILDDLFPAARDYAPAGKWMTGDTFGDVVTQVMDWYGYAVDAGLLQAPDGTDDDDDSPGTGTPRDDEIATDGMDCIDDSAGKTAIDRILEDEKMAPRDAQKEVLELSREDAQHVVDCSSGRVFKVRKLEDIYMRPGYAPDIIDLVQTIDARPLMRLQDLLQKNAKRGMGGGHIKGKRLDKKRLAAVQTTVNARPFTRREQKTERNYVLLIAIDFSGSMTYTGGGTARIVQAVGAGIIIARAAEAAGIKTAIRGYSATRDYGDGQQVDYLLKDWDDILTPQLIGKIALRAHTLVGNPTAAALRHYSDILLDRPETDRLYLDLSDSAEVEGDGSTHMTQDIMRNAGIIQYGQIGIGCPPLYSIYQLCRGCDDMDNLPIIALDLLMDMINQG